MKKLNLILAVPLLAIGLFSALLVVSCSEESVVIEEEKISEFDQQFVLPKGLNLEGEELATYLHNADENLLHKLKANAKLFHYLIKEDLYDNVFKQMNDGVHLSDLDMLEILNNDQLNEFETYSFPAHLKVVYSCNYFARWGPCRYYNCCYYEYGYCYTVAKC